MSDLSLLPSRQNPPAQADVGLSAVSTAEAEAQEMLPRILD